jgi:hypothetical protein
MGVLYFLSGAVRSITDLIDNPPESGGQALLNEQVKR